MWGPQNGRHTLIGNNKGCFKIFRFFVVGFFGGIFSGFLVKIEGSGANREVRVHGPSEVCGEKRLG